LSSPNTALSPFVVIFERRHCLPHAGGFLLPGGEIIFILYDMTKEVGQGSGSLKRMGGYDRFISLLFYAFPEHACFSDISMLFQTLL
jgi:hypothetical protein